MLYADKRYAKTSVAAVNGVAKENLVRHSRTASQYYGNSNNNNWKNCRSDHDDELRRRGEHLTTAYRLPSGVGSRLPRNNKVTHN